MEFEAVLASALDGGVWLASYEQNARTVQKNSAR